MTAVKDLCILFPVGAVGYCALEILWRGRTHLSMAVVGGICFVLIYVINKYLPDYSYTFRAFLCAVAITLVELMSGVVLNIVLRLNVWDYSKSPFNILGQICPLYSILWFCLSFVIICVGNSYFKEAMTAFL